MARPKSADTVTVNSGIPPRRSETAEFTLAKYGIEMSSDMCDMLRYICKRFGWKEFKKPKMEGKGKDNLGFSF